MEIIKIGEVSAHFAIFCHDFLMKSIPFFPRIWKIHVVTGKRDSALVFAAIQTRDTEISIFVNCEGLLHDAFISSDCDQARGFPRYILFFYHIAVIAMIFFL